MAELADAKDSKSFVLRTCGFKSHSGYKIETAWDVVEPLRFDVFSADSSNGVPLKPLLMAEVLRPWAIRRLASVG